MNPNDNKNNKNNKPGGNWRGVASLVGWALLLTIIFSYASSVIGSTGRQASSINVEYGEFQEMVESGQVARVEFDNAEDILLITPEEGYSYTAEDGTVYTKTEDGYTYMDAAGQEQTAHLELFTVRIQSNDAVIDFLNEYGVEGVDKEYQAPVNPVLAMLVSYVLPFVLIFLMFSLVMRWMAKKGGMGGMGDIFDQLFNGGMGGSAQARRNAPRQGNDVRYELRLTFEEAAKGCHKSVEFYRYENCATCGGSGAKPGTQPQTCAKARGKSARAAAG